MHKGRPKVYIPWNLIDDDNAEGAALHGLDVLVAAGVAVVVDRRYTAPMVNGVTVDLCCHRILKSQAHKLHTVLPAEPFFH